MKKTSQTQKKLQLGENLKKNWKNKSFALKKKVLKMNNIVSVYGKLNLFCF